MLQLVYFIDISTKIFLLVSLHNHRADNTSIEYMYIHICNSAVSILSVRAGYYLSFMLIQTNTKEVFTHKLGMHSLTLGVHARGLL